MAFKKKKSDGAKTDTFKEVLRGKKVPVLTLDQKWYRLFRGNDRKSLKNEEQALNDLLKEQGKLNTDSRDIRLLKKKLLNELTPGAGEENLDPKKVEEHKRLIEDCNSKLDSYKEKLLDMPEKIDEANFELMLLTMDNCYSILKDNSDDISEIEKWVKETRVLLKKKLIEKQEKEQINHEIYSYMHDIFGAEVLDIFDLKYDPEEKHPHLPK
ncbi:MAG: hypothetical protein J6033_06320 [Lachnospiraceae bacterium]|nr:hypothetical protein [Lachnospiraceae bacterium]